MRLEEAPDDTIEDRYLAMETRDEARRADFVAAVTSTGIYCRPGCPARTPNRENVRFYATPAGAREDGFRACKRCAPDGA
jgi:AraC family transcriptional regulator of adaptative response / DNA-3-methyladenine glycosylase II